MVVRMRKLETKREERASRMQAAKATISRGRLERRRRVWMSGIEGREGEAEGGMRFARWVDGPRFG